VPVPDGASADSASVLAAQPPRPTSRKRLRGGSGAVGQCANAQEAAMHLPVTGTEAATMKSALKFHRSLGRVGGDDAGW